MSETEVRLGDVTYLVRRIFLGSQTAAELLIDSVVDRTKAENAVDGAERPAV